MKNVSKIVIVPGNHVADVKKSIWYYWCQQHLLKGLNVRRLGIPVILEDMPDPDAAHRDVWLPFIKQELRCDENTILIGHSSGAEAAMRYCPNSFLLCRVVQSPTWCGLQVDGGTTGTGRGAGVGVPHRPGQS
jgi:predicted alpha/beta hydrolase family esterase